MPPSGGFSFAQISAGVAGPVKIPIAEGGHEGTEIPLPPPHQPTKSRFPFDTRFFLQGLDNLSGLSLAWTSRACLGFDQMRIATHNTCVGLRLFLGFDAFTDPFLHSIPASTGLRPRNALWVENDGNPPPE